MSHTENIAESDHNEADRGEGPSKKELDKKVNNYVIYYLHA